MACFNPKSRSIGSRPRSGFTLVEVVLAISIAIGLLAVALYFYQQATRLRGELLQRSEEIAAARLLLDRMTTELRTAFTRPGLRFAGDAHSLSFWRVRLPAVHSQEALLVSRRSVPEPDSDLAQVQYGLLTTMAGTNAEPVGVGRTEHSWKQLQRPIRDLAERTAALEQTETNVVLQPLAAQFRRLDFSYWDGTQWTSFWNGSHPPLGIAITLGADTVTEEIEAASDTSERYFRIVSLPSATGGAVQENKSRSETGFVPGQVGGGSER